MRRKRKLKALVQELQVHHSWHPAALPLHLQLRIYNMWWCQQCNFSNAADHQYCASCQRPWQQVWVSKRRSRSKKDKKDKEKSVRSDGKETRQVTSQPSTATTPIDAWEVIPEKVPWIVTTPNAHLRSKETVAETETPLGLPPAPVLPVPPVHNTGASSQASGANKEASTLEHLQGLVSLGVQLPEELIHQMNQLQQKTKDSLASRQLTHGHLHKLNRLRGQVQTAAQRVVELDNEWIKFKDQVMSRLGLHGEMYQQCRADRLELYNRKVQELSQAKLELNAASMNLLEQVPPPEAAPVAQDVNELLLQAGQTLANAAMVDTVDLLEDEGVEAVHSGMEEDPVDSPELEENGPTKHTSYRVRVAPFRNAASPSKVAQHTLKPEKPPAKNKRDR